MRYAQPEDVGRAALDRARAAGDVDGICSALIGLALHDEDGRWLQDTCLSLLGHEAAAVRNCAAIGLGHVARIHRTLDRDAVVPSLESLLSDPATKGPASDALDDIATFLP